MPMEWVPPSFLGPALAYFTGLNTTLLTYCILQLVIFLVGFTALIWVIRRRDGDFVARCVLFAFFLSPLPNVLFTWLGTPDILTTRLAMSIVVLWEHPAAALTCGFLLGINHPEQGLAILLLLIVFSALARRAGESIRFGALSLLSLFAGAWLVQQHLYRYNFDIVYTRRDYILSTGLAAFGRSGLREPFALVFSLFNLLIVFVAAYMARFKDKVARVFLVYAGLALLSILVTFDQTRVFAVLTLPALVLLARSPAFKEVQAADLAFFAAVLVVSFAAGILVPRFVVWDGRVSSSAYSQFIAFLQSQSTVPSP